MAKKKTGKKKGMKKTTKRTAKSKAGSRAEFEIGVMAGEAVARIPALERKVEQLADEVQVLRLERNKYSADLVAKDQELFQAQQQAAVFEQQLKGKEALLDLERLAALEHKQWAEWARTLMEKEPAISPERKERWQRLLNISYEMLTEEEKEQDRVWARKIRGQG